MIFAPTVISCVGATDCRRILPGLSGHSEGVSTDSSRGVDHEPGEGLEVEPELADVLRHLVDGEGAGGGAARLVAAGVGGVPDVGRVGGDGGATAGAEDDAAHPEPGRTFSVSGAAFGGALRAGEAGPVGRAGACSGALLVGELDDGEEGQGLWQQDKPHF